MFLFLKPSASGELTVTALASVSDGELAKFFLKNNVCLMSGVNLPSIQLGGMVATASHVSVNIYTLSYRGGSWNLGKGGGRGRGGGVSD